MVRSLLSREEKKQYFIKFNVDGLLRGDYQSRMNGYATARQNGWMSANDIRALENLNPIPDEEGGNTYLCNGNLVPVALAGISMAAAAVSALEDQPTEETQQEQPTQEQPPQEPPKSNKRTRRNGH